MTDAERDELTRLAHEAIRLEAEYRAADRVVARKADESAAASERLAEAMDAAGLKYMSVGNMLIYNYPDEAGVDMRSDAYISLPDMEAKS